MTNTAQHTPAPWEFGLNGNNEMIVTAHRMLDKPGAPYVKCQCIIASGLYDENNEGSLEEIEANARLIAAAPQLLAAAKRALEYLTDHGIDLDGHEEEIVAGIRADLDDAITKAKGE